MPAKGHDAALREKAKAIWIAQRGRLSAPQLSRAMVAAGLPHKTPATLSIWRKEGRWEEALGVNEVATPLSRAVRGREIQDLILDRGGELMLLEGVYGEMLLGAASVTSKMLTWANRLDPTTLKPGEAVDVLKAIPALVDRAVKLKETMTELKWRGSAAQLTNSGDPSALNGEVLPPEGQKGQDDRTKGTERTPEPEPQSVQPALADALAAIVKAQKAAPTLVKDVAPKARASIR